MSKKLKFSYVIMTFLVVALLVKEIINNHLTEMNAQNDNAVSIIILIIWALLTLVAAFTKSEFHYFNVLLFFMLSLTGALLEPPKMSFASDFFKTSVLVFLVVAINELISIKINKLKHG